MSTVYLLQNQDKHFLDRSGAWVASDHMQSLYRTAYKDEAINQKVEFSVKNPHLRITITPATLNEKGKLQLVNGDIISTGDNSLPLNSDTSEHTRGESDSPVEDIFEDGIEFQFSPEEVTQHEAADKQLESTPNPY